MRFIDYLSDCIHVKYIRIIKNLSRYVESIGRMMKGILMYAYRHSSLESGLLTLLEKLLLLLVGFLVCHPTLLKYILVTRQYFIFLLTLLFLVFEVFSACLAYHPGISYGSLWTIGTVASTPSPHDLDDAWFQRTPLQIQSSTRVNMSGRMANSGGRKRIQTGAEWIQDSSPKHNRTRSLQHILNEQVDGLLCSNAKSIDDRLQLVRLVSDSASKVMLASYWKYHCTRTATSLPQ